jgi:hypothetical protein
MLGFTPTLGQSGVATTKLIQNKRNNNKGKVINNYLRIVPCKRR